MTMVITKALEPLGASSVECGLHGQAAGDRVVVRDHPVLEFQKLSKKGPNSEARVGSGTGVLKDSWIFRKMPFATDLTC